MSPSPTAGPTAITPPATASGTPATRSLIPTYGYRVINTFPHDPAAFTQGLEFEDGVLYEGTGLNGESSLRRVALETGEVLQQHDLGDEFFGEGITILNDRIYQLTWQSGTGFVYDQQTFEPLGEFAYSTEGWGLTDDDTHLIMSDGSSTLYFRDPETFDEVRRVEVHDNRGPVTMLNELEYIDGEIYANVWRTDIIVRIDPSSGDVTGRIDLSGLLSDDDRRGYQPDVLNGIAHDPASGRLLVTGKRWPKLFEIEILDG